MQSYPVLSIWRGQDIHSGNCPSLIKMSTGSWYIVQEVITESLQCCDEADIAYFFALHNCTDKYVTTISQESEMGY